MKKIIFTGGGTGGHIMPNIALIEKLKGKYDCKYIGSKDSMEQKLISPILPFFEVETCKLKRSLSLSNLLIPFKLAKGICQAKKILKKERPDIIFSKGGFVSVPVVIAGHILKIPIVAHESDYSMGLANKITKRYAKTICTSFEDTAKSIKNGVYTGSPIRQEIYVGNTQKIVRQFGLSSAKPTLLIVGGSLGSKNINNLIEKNQDKLAKEFNILHITGKNNLTKSHTKDYHSIEFADNIQDYFSACDICITRGGSNMIFELLALKKPMLIIPLSKGSRGDQIENAKVFSQNGWAKMLTEEEIENNSSLFFKKIEEVQKDKQKMIFSMKTANTDGTQNIIAEIEKALK